MVSIRIFPDELIGETVTIADSTQKQEIGFTGMVVDETKMTLKIEREGKIKVFLKRNISIKLKTGDVIRGSTLNKRSEDRIKGK